MATTTHRLVTAVVLLLLVASSACGTQARLAGPSSRGCRGPSTPQMLSNKGMEDTRAEAKDYPRIRRATDISWHGATGRFRIELHNPTCASWDRTQLHFTLDPVGRDPDNVRLEYLDGGAWHRLRLSSPEPDLSEQLQSDPLLVDFDPGQTRSYDLRLTLPKAPSEPRAFSGLGARLDAAGDHGYEWASSTGVFSKTPQQLTVTAPRTVTAHGAAAPFEVTVTNHGDLGRDDRVRLDLTTGPTRGQLIHPGTLFEMYRDGGWHRMSAANPSTPDFTLPKGAVRTFTFRARVGTAGAWDPMGLGAQLRRRGESVGVPPLASASRRIVVLAPELAVRVPPPPKAGDVAKLDFTVSNETGVDYPSLRVDLAIYGRRFVDRIRYRAGSGPWRTLSVPKQPQMFDLELPVDGPVAAPDGFRRTYSLRLDIGHTPTEAMNYTASLVDTRLDAQIRRSEASLR